MHSISIKQPNELSRLQLNQYHEIVSDIFLEWTVHISPVLSQCPVGEMTKTGRRIWTRTAYESGCSWLAGDFLINVQLSVDLVGIATEPLHDTKLHNLVLFWHTTSKQATLVTTPAVYGRNWSLFLHQGLEEPNLTGHQSLATEPRE